MLPFLEGVTDTMSDAVLVINTAGTVVSVNQAALNLLDIADNADALRPLDQLREALLLQARHHLVGVGQE